MVSNLAKRAYPVKVGRAFFFCLSMSLDNSIKVYRRSIRRWGYVGSEILASPDWKI